MAQLALAGQVGEKYMRLHFDFIFWDCGNIDTLMFILFIFLHSATRSCATSVPPAQQMPCTCPCSRRTPRQQGLHPDIRYVRCCCRHCGFQEGGRHGCHVRGVAPPMARNVRCWICRALGVPDDAPRNEMPGRHLRTLLFPAVMHGSLF